MGPHPRIRTVGESGFLMELDSLPEVMAAQSMLLHSRPAGVVDVVAAARTVLVQCDSPASAKAARSLLSWAGPLRQEPVAGTLHTMETTYDGADLAAAARLAGMGTDALIRWHTGQDWLAAFGGFAPGFMYLTPAVKAIEFARRATPRTAVPAGSVAVGGRFSAVYPGPTPGGWQLLGRCAGALWDSGRAEPSLLQPGDRVRFKPVRELVQLGSDTGGSPAMGAHPGPEPLGLEVISAGVSATVQDLGRPGFAHLGVTASGALDRPALRRANRMVGNPPSPGAGAAALELVLSGLRVRARGSQLLAVAGAAVQLTATDPSGLERDVPTDAPLVLGDGEVLAVLPQNGISGFRSILAVRGGIDVPAVLGSRSSDVLSGLGPAPLQAGTFLPVGRGHQAVPVGFPEASPPAAGADPTVLRFVPGPRSDWFTPGALAAFERVSWQAGAQSNRIGLRLELAHTGPEHADPPLRRTAEAAGAELPSEGMAGGAIQVPPSGLPVLFLADHPVTGGYPVLGVVLRADLAQAAQLAPGAAVRFRAVSPGGPS